jgi:hypothetical protein
MDKSKILDFWESEENRDSFSGVRKWWESRRKKYNLVVGLTVFIMFLIEFGMTKHSSNYWSAYLADVAMCIILANIGYTSSWMIVEPFYKGVTDTFLTEKTANTLFKLGLICSVILVVITGIYSIIYFR